MSSSHGNIVCFHSRIWWWPFNQGWHLPSLSVKRRINFLKINRLHAETVFLCSEWYTFLPFSLIYGCNFFHFSNTGYYYQICPVLLIDVAICFWECPNRTSESHGGFGIWGHLEEKCLKSKVDGRLCSLSWTNRDQEIQYPCQRACWPGPSSHLGLAFHVVFGNPRLGHLWPGQSLHR